MSRYKVVFDKDACIGVLACVAVAEKYWKDTEDGKVELVGGKINEDTGLYELIVEADEEPVLRESADVCPVMAIRVEKID